MDDVAAKADLLHYLQTARDAVLWKLEGLSEYDVRRPLTPTGTNLLGLVKHLGIVELGYFGATFGRPSGEPTQEWDDDAATNADMWATADQSRDEVVDRYRRAWAMTDATVAALDLDALGTVAWWPPETATVPLRRVLVHVIAETHRHAGHADLVRELIDGAAGLRPGNSNLPEVDADWWSDYHARLEQVARLT